jgi:hypothetical protein
VAVFTPNLVSSSVSQAWEQRDELLSHRCSSLVLENDSVQLGSRGNLLRGVSTQSPNTQQAVSSLPTFPWLLINRLAIVSTFNGSAIVLIKQSEESSLRDGKQLAQQYQQNLDKRQEQFYGHAK